MDHHEIPLCLVTALGTFLPARAELLSEHDLSHPWHVPTPSGTAELAGLVAWAARLPAHCQQHGQLSADGDSSRDQEGHDVIFRSVREFSAAMAGKKQHFPCEKGHIHSGFNEKEINRKPGSDCP